MDAYEHGPVDEVQLDVPVFGTAVGCHNRLERVDFDLALKMMARRSILAAPAPHQQARDKLPRDFTSREQIFLGNRPTDFVLDRQVTG